MKKTFTPLEANRTLPLVRRIVSDVLDTGRTMRELVEASDGDPPAHRTRELESQFRRLMKELDDIGCQYKDWGFNMGLVDFPGEIAGEEVLLCWRSDEDSVSWYHAHDAGYAGRTAIPAELLKEEPEPSSTSSS